MARNRAQLKSFVLLFFATDALRKSEMVFPSPSAGLVSLGFSNPEETEEVSGRRKSIPIYHLVANTGQSLTLPTICK